MWKDTIWNQELCWVLWDAFGCHLSHFVSICQWAGQKATRLNPPRPDWLHGFCVPMSVWLKAAASAAKRSQDAQDSQDNLDPKMERLLKSHLKPARFLNRLSSRRWRMIRRWSHASSIHIPRCVPRVKAVPTLMSFMQMRSTFQGPSNAGATRGSGFGNGWRNIWPRRTYTKCTKNFRRTFFFFLCVCVCPSWKKSKKTHEKMMKDDETCDELSLDVFGASSASSESIWLGGLGPLCKGSDPETFDDQRIGWSRHHPVPMIQFGWRSRTKKTVGHDVFTCFL